MRFFTAAIALFGAPLAVAKACNANNCLRAVVASAYTTRHASADCSSFLSQTVTPATSTVTISTAISTVTVTSIPPNKRNAAPSPPPALAPALAPRQITAIPSSIPAYASACSGTSAYSSACSCIGVTPTTTTLPTPTTTTTISYTTTTTITTIPPTTTTPSCGDLPVHFLLQIFNSTPALDGTYGAMGGLGFTILFTGETSTTDASIFSLWTTGNLNWERYIGKLGGGLQFGPIVFNDLPDTYTHNVAVVCSIAGGEMTCQAGDAAGVDVLQICTVGTQAGVLALGSTLQDGCFEPVLKVVGVC